VLLVGGIKAQGVSGIIGKILNWFKVVECVTKAAGEERVQFTQAMIFSADEMTDIGYEFRTAVSADYTAETSKFNGVINWVQLDQGADDHDHFIDRTSA
jgi:hypothetical protein